MKTVLHADKLGTLFSYHRTCILWMLSLWAVSVSGWAQNRPPSESDPAYREELQRLLVQPEMFMRFQAAPLRDVLRTLAESAQMPFIGLPRGQAEGVLVDMTIRGNPYKSLVTVAENYGFAVVYENGLWFFRPIVEERAKLVPRMYKLKYIHLSSVSTEGSASSPQVQRSNVGVGSGQTGGLQGALPAPINTDVFKSEAAKLIEDIEGLLELDPGILSLGATAGDGESGSETAEKAGNAASDLFLGTSANDIRAGFADSDLVRGSGGLRQNQRAPETKGHIIADADHNALFVVATNQHHEWIDLYISNVDKPRRLILLETRFVEVRKNPTIDKGVDWTNILGSNGYNLGLYSDEHLKAESRNFSSSSNASTSQSSSVATTTDGISQGLNNSQSASTSVAEGIARTFVSPFDLAEGNLLFANNIGGAILSGPELNLTLRFLASTNDARNLQHPSQVTINNRQVVLRNVRQEPFESGSTSVTASTANTSTSNQIQFLPIGTTISLLPRIIEGDNVELNILINVSDLAGFRTINGTATPITTSRDYAGQAIVSTGNTLAIGGLESLLENNNETKVPFLGDIPFFGFLFNRTQKERQNTQLLMFITATILEGYDGGVRSSPAIDQFIEDARAYRTGEEPQIVPGWGNLRPGQSDVNDDQDSAGTEPDEQRTIPRRFSR
jgi:hypothetical protein